MTENASRDQGGRREIPYHRPTISESEIDEVVDTLKSGWLTTGPKTKQFEAEFAAYVGARHAVALNSATAALHLALEAVGLKRGEAVIVPTMTFAATAEVVRYFDAKPILVDCTEDDMNLDPAGARAAAEAAVRRGEKLRAIIPVHYGGKAADMASVASLARDFDLKVIEDAAHCCPAHYRQDARHPWRHVGAESSVCCYSFYANKCITTGEGGMACTDDDGLAERMRLMSLHGISKDAWKRFSAQGSWSYEIAAPGYKYNLTDIAASLGLHQVRRADEFRDQRERVAHTYRRHLSGVAELTIPVEDDCHRHAWHLYAVRLKLDRIRVDRAAVIESLRSAGIGTSVHWVPLHMHPYYRETYSYKAADFPVAAKVSAELISLPIYPGLADDDVRFVAATLGKILAANRR